MENISLISQLIVAISVIFIWVFRYNNIVDEFKHYGYSDLLRNIVGASKISISTLLIMGVWYKEITMYASLAMAFFMICAQVSHIKVKNPLIKFIPSLIFLLMSLFVAAFNFGIL
ncbi:MAG: DoxX family protein [Alphaproteobacteria bacterium]